MSMPVHATDWSAIHCNPRAPQRAKIVKIRLQQRSTNARLGNGRAHVNPAGKGEGEPSGKILQFEEDKSGIPESVLCNL
jgi:hypothetical protein